MCAGTVAAAISKPALIELFADCIIVDGRALRVCNSILIKSSNCILCEHNK